jgi:hypothetical protein
MPEMVLGDIDSWCRLYLAAKPSHVGVNVDELACPYTVIWYVTVRRRDMASCQALPCPVVL